MGGIHNVRSMPDDPKDNKYDETSDKRICNEFEIDPSSDFRFKHGANHGLGSVYNYVRGPFKTGANYPGYDKFSDEGGSAIKGNAIYYIEADDVADVADVVPTAPKA